MLLQCAAWLLLALVCANLACLFGARAMARRRESAVLLALGARGRDVVSVYLQEALVLCAAGTGLALLLARLARPVIVSMLPDLNRIGPELLDPSLLLTLFGAIVCLVSACAVGLPAARQALRTDLLENLKSAGHSPGESRIQWPAVLLAAQVAIVLVLLTVTGLISRSFAAALRSNPGFDPAGVVTFRASLPVNGKALTGAAFELTQLVRDLPGTKDAAFAAEPPVGASMATVMSAHGSSFASTDPTIAFRMTGSRYFETLGASFVRGRPFSQEEVERGASVLVLNEAAAQALFHGEDPVGREVHVGFLDLRSQVIGVVRNLRHESLDQPSPPVAYLPFIPVFDAGVSVVARTAVPPPVFLSGLKARISVWNNGALVRGFRPLEEITAATVRDRLISGFLVGWFAMLGLLVSSLGLYGALSGQLQRRRAEIGVRMALGASARSVIGLLLGQGARVLAAGIGVGLAASLAAGYFIRTMLYQVQPIDWVSSAVSVLLLVMAGLLACFVPAIRAVGVDPGVALRNE
jgi:predicted permease